MCTYTQTQTSVRTDGFQASRRLERKKSEKIQFFFFLLPPWNVQNIALSQLEVQKRLAWILHSEKKKKKPSFKKDKRQRCRHERETLPSVC